MWLDKIHYTIMQLWICHDKLSYFYDLEKQNPNTVKLLLNILSGMGTQDPLFIIFSDEWAVNKYFGFLFSPRIFIDSKELIRITSK